MKYLIKIGPRLYGYNRPELLHIDILSRKPTEVEIYKMRDGGMTVTYNRISLEQLRIDSKQNIQQGVSQ